MCESECHCGDVCCSMNLDNFAATTCGRTVSEDEDAHDGLAAVRTRKIALAGRTFRP